MNKWAICLFFFAMMGSSAHACDACACSASGGGIGLVTQSNTTLLGIRWQTNRFRSIAGYEEGSATLDRFYQTEFWGQYRFNDRLMLGFSLPYRHNIRTGDNTLPLDLSGLGDLSFNASYALINQNSEEGRVGHQLRLGVGIKLPTGKYNPIQDDRLPDNMNLGTASTDFNFLAIHLLEGQKLGVQTQLNYRWNTKNKYNYRFGNQFTAQTNVFLKGSGGRFQFIPYAGAYVEHTSKDELYGESPHGTGGMGLYGSIGSDFYYQNFTLSLSAQLPVAQSYSDEEVHNQGRFAVNLAYIF